MRNDIELGGESQVVCAYGLKSHARAAQPKSRRKSHCLGTDKGLTATAISSGIELSSKGRNPAAQEGLKRHAFTTQPTSGVENPKRNAEGQPAVVPNPRTKHAKRSEECQPAAADKGLLRRASSDLPLIVEHLILQHRRRRFAMKTQQKLDRALESFVRRNYTAWSPDASDKDREKQNRLVKKMIDDANNGIGDPDILALVSTNVESRSIWDAIRAGTEKDRLRICKTLPIAGWLEGVRGASLSGLADIIGEAGDLGKYATVAKLYKRLGFAPYGGLAGSTWKRESWRPRALTKEEWIANPFSGERYGIMRSLADSMFRANGIGKDNPKNQTGSWQPTGHYGELYARRRAHTRRTHEEWTDGHAHADALRYMFKKYLRDLWKAWRAAANPSPEEAPRRMPPSTPPLGS